MDPMITNCPTRLSVARPFLILSTTLLLLTVSSLNMTMAQTASDGCSYGGGSEYTSSTSCTYQDFDKPGGFGNDLNPSGCSGSNNDDAFGWFTATSTSTTITYDPDNSHDAIMHLFTGACGSLTNLVCANANGAGGNETITYATTVGTNYLIRIQRNGTNQGMDGRICIWGIPPAPANDDPCGAVSLAVGTTCSNTAGTNVSATTTGAGIPAPGCGSFTGGDVWYSFVAPANGIANIETSAGTLNNTDIALYSATACGGTFTLIECDDLDGPGNMGGIYRTGLTPGQTYYVRVWGNGGATGTFNICVVSLANDEPCGAVSLTVNTSCSNTSTGNAYATSTGAGIPAPGCGSFSGGDVWYSFVAPANGAANIETTSGTLTNTDIALYSATACNGTFTLIECDDNDGAGSNGAIYRTGLTAGQTYYVRVWGNGGASGTFNICIWAPPVNDDPCGAIALTLGSSCSLTSYSNASATNTAGIPAPGCGTYSGEDVWFSFVAPASGAVAIRTTSGSITNLAMALYTATACNGTFTLIQCDDNDGPGNMPFLVFSSVDLVPGQTYYLRVWESGGGTGTFNLCASTSPTASAGECLYTLRMGDSQGDGWGGSTVSVQIGAGPVTNYTLSTGDQEVAYFNVPSGQLVQISYTAVGGSQNEISYFVHLGAGVLYQDGPTPGTGLRYASFANCTPPSPPNSDCWGGATICNSQQINDTPNHNTGVKHDLTGDNRGCLAAEERQGTWYVFSPSAGGTIEFTISPANPANDYDFAVWGPYASAACPPSGPPYRCNYSGSTGDTGLSTAATNDSEGAGGSKWSNEMVVTVGQVYVLYISNYSRSGLAFTLSWQLTGGSSLDCTLLPVELSAFDAQPREKDVLLNWITGSEMNSSHFNVQRSTDGVAFASIGVVAAQGNTSTTSHYEFVDPQPASGVNYYRLEQVDMDGTSKLSEVEAVVFRRLLSTGSPYPNPTMDQIYLDLVVGADPDVLISTMDASGRMVRTERMRFAAGEQRYQSSVAGLDAGWYELLLTLSDGEVLHTGRFMVQ